jgi:hypothetical protein
VEDGSSTGTLAEYVAGNYSTSIRAENRNIAAGLGTESFYQKTSSSGEHGEEIYYYY